MSTSIKYIKTIIITDVNSVDWVSSNIELIKRVITKVTVFKTSKVSISFKFSNKKSVLEIREPNFYWLRFTIIKSLSLLSYQLLC